MFEGWDKRFPPSTELFISALLFAALLYVIFGFLSEYRECSGLASRGLHTLGTITAVTPDKHDTYKFRYAIGGSSYSGQGHISGLDRYPKVGDRVDVLYDPASPQLTSTPGPYRHEISNCFGYIRTLFLVGGAISAFLVAFAVDAVLQMRSRRRSAGT